MNNKKGVNSLNYSKQKFETCFDDSDSAPIVSNSYTSQSDYNQNQQNNLPYQSTVNPETPYYYSDSEKIPKENNIISNSNIQTETISVCKIIIQYILACILFAVSFIDILLQLIFLYINLFLLIDDIAIISISLVYLIYTFKRKKFNTLICVLTPIIWFGGFASKGYGLTLLNDRIKNKSIPSSLPIILFFMVVIRTFAIFFYIPITGS